MCTHLRRWSLPLLALVAGLATVSTAPAAEPAGTIEVQGTSQVTFTPDRLRLQARIMARGKTVDEAVATLKSQRDALRVALLKAGADEPSITFGKPAQDDLLQRALRIARSVMALVDEEVTVNGSIPGFGPVPLPRYAAYSPARVEELAADADDLRQAGDEWERFWFLDQPSHLNPFGTYGGLAATGPRVVPSPAHATEPKRAGEPSLPPDPASPPTNPYGAGPPASPGAPNPYGAPVPASPAPTVGFGAPALPAPAKPIDPQVAPARLEVAPAAAPPTVPQAVAPAQYGAPAAPPTVPQAVPTIQVPAVVAVGAPPTTPKPDAPPAQKKEPKPTEPIFIVSCTVTAEWALDADGDAAIRKGAKVRDQVERANITGIDRMIDEFLGADSEFLQVLEEYPDARRILDEVKHYFALDFDYVRNLTDADRDRVVSEAFAKAKREADLLARASGGKLGPLVRLTLVSVESEKPSLFAWLMAQAQDDDNIKIKMSGNELKFNVAAGSKKTKDTVESSEVDLDRARGDEPDDVQARVGVVARFAIDPDTKR